MMEKEHIAKIIEKEFKKMEKRQGSGPILITGKKGMDLFNEAIKKEFERQLRKQIYFL